MSKAHEISLRLIESSTSASVITSLRSRISVSPANWCAHDLSFLSIPEAFKLDEATIGHQPDRPVLLLPTQDVDQTYLLDGLMINMKITTPGCGDDSTREGQFALPLQVDVVRLPAFGDGALGSRQLSTWFWMESEVQEWRSSVSHEARAMTPMFTAFQPEWHGERTNEVGGNGLFDEQ